MSKNLMSTDCQRRSSRKSLRILPFFVGAVGAACNTELTPVTSVNIAQPPGQILAGQIFNQEHQLIEAAGAFCRSLAWTTCFSPEYTDDQAFMGDNKQIYGPAAFIAPAQDLNNHTSDNSFQASPVLAGYVFILPGQAPLPSTYTDLRLNYGHNCVYLWHTGGAFRAYVVAPTGTCGAYTANPADQLNVLAIASAAFPGHPNIPPVARFHEGNKGQTAGVPFLGMKCGDKWCLVLPQAQPGQNVSEWSPPHAGVHNNLKTWAVYGWNDSQHLAVRNPMGLMRSTMRASVVADTNLGNLTEAHFAQGFQHVATVFFTGGTSDKYRDSWHYDRGHNEVFLRKNNDGSWKAEIRRRRYVLGIPWGWWVTPASVDRRDHGVPIPATARFLWTVSDEDLWIECDDGCCRVSGE